MTRFLAVTSPADLEALWDASTLGPIILFKHSQTCGASHLARALLAEGDLPAFVHELVVQTHRDLANSVASALRVRHESPQALIVVNRHVAWHGSHAGVTPERIGRAWRDAARDVAAAAR